MFVSRSLANPAPPTTVTSPDGKLTASLRHGGAFLKSDFGSYKPEKILATNWYPDPSHEYGLAPHTATLTTNSAFGNLALDNSQHHSGLQSIKMTNTTPRTVSRTNLIPAPYWNPSTVMWSGNGTGLTIGAGDVYQGRASVRATPSGVSTNNVGIRTLFGAGNNPALQAGHTYWVAADCYAHPNLILNLVSGQVQINMVARDDPNADSSAAAFIATTYVGNRVAGQWFRIYTKITVNAGRTVTGLYWSPSVPANTVQPATGYFQLDNVMVAEVVGNEATPPDYFDGGSPATATYGGTKYAWTGTAIASTSQSLIPTYTLIASNKSNLGTPASFGAVNGDTITFSGWVKIPTGVSVSATTLRLAGAAMNNGVQTVATTPVRDQFTKISISATVTDANGGMTVGIYGGTMSDDVIWFDDFSLMVGLTTEDFNGDTPVLGDIDYRWRGAAGASASDKYNPALAWNPSVIQGPITQQGGVYTYAGEDITGQLDFTFDGNTPADENFRYGWQDDAHTIAVAEPLNPIEATRFVRDGDLDTGFLVRSGADAVAVDGIAYAYDFEAPLAASSTWTAYPVFKDGTWDEPTMSVTLTLDAPTGCYDSWVKSTASPELSQRVFITADTVPQFSYAADNQLDYPQGSAFPVGTYGVHRAATATLTAYTETDVDEAAMRELLVSTGELLFQTDPKYGIEDFYFVVGDIAMTLVWVDELHLQARQWSIPVTVTARPDPTGAPLVIPGESYDDQPDITYDQQSALDQTYSEQTEATLAVVA